MSFWLQNPKAKNWKAKILKLKEFDILEFFFQIFKFFYLIIIFPAFKFQFFNKKKKPKVLSRKVYKPNFFILTSKSYES